MCKLLAILLSEKLETNLVKKPYSEILTLPYYMVVLYSQLYSIKKFHHKFLKYSPFSFLLRTGLILSCFKVWTDRNIEEKPHMDRALYK